MCARIVQLLLAGFFVFVVATIAAFRYLEWWQALLASAATFVTLIYAAKWYVKSLIGNIGNMAKGLFDAKSRVLRGATVQVHTVRSAEAPADAVSDEPDPDEADEPVPTPNSELSWYEIEATIFPDPKAAGPMNHWDLDDLRLVPFDAPPVSMDDESTDDRPESAVMHEIRVVVDGVAEEPEGSKFQGPHRLRIVVGFPKYVREAKFQYYFEYFGHVRLSPALAR